MICITPIPRTAIAGAWPELLAVLAPAISHDPNATPEDVRRDLARGRKEAAWLEDGTSRGVVVAEICMMPGSERACWINYLAASIRRAGWLAIVRAGMAHFERLAREAGCSALYIGGRDWSRVFPDFARSPVAGDPHRLRKALL